MEEPESSVLPLDDSGMILYFYYNTNKKCLTEWEKSVKLVIYYYLREGFNMKKIYGFTLSEVLITLAVVGIIAVLTVPNVVGNVYKNAYSKKLGATYKDLTTALKTMMLEERTNDLMDTVLFTDANGEGSFFKTYMQVNKDCGSTVSDCIAATYKFKGTDVNSSSFVDNNYYCVMLNTGTAVCASGDDSDNITDFVIDINGKASPNVAGSDLFRVQVNNQGRLYNTEGLAGCEDDDIDAIAASQMPTKAATLLSRYFCKVMNDGWEINY